MKVFDSCSSNEVVIGSGRTSRFPLLSAQVLVQSVKEGSRSPIA